jgi:SRSO17 transposase
MPALREVQRWDREAEAVAERIGGRFGRREQRQHAARYLRGLLARVERKNGWQLAEQLGEETPTNLQHFIARAQWDAEQVRDDLREYVVEQLGEADGVLMIDETGFLKKGVKSVGVKRQYSGTAGRIENCQIGVFLAYRTTHGSAFLDRALYLPREWADDAARRQEAKIPPEVAFATKPQLAREMLARALDAGVPAAWLTADEVYGSDPAFRSFCEERRMSYVVAISSATHLFLSGKRCAVARHAAEIPAEAWRRLSCDAGAKGQREYDWAFVSWPHHEQDTHVRGWLVRRSLADPTELAFYFTYAPRGTSLAKLVTVAGSRWASEEGFEQAKQETGLDEYEVRSWIGWHRHVTLSLLAHATLAALRALAAKSPARKKSVRSSR